MIDHFKEKFIIEAHELLERLEETVLSLEKDVTNTENIQEIFRVVHTLKGSGAMFGMESLSEFAHGIEDLFDYIRKGEISVNAEIINICFSVIDHFKVLLTDNINADDIIQGEKIIEKVNAYLVKTDKNQDSSSGAVQSSIIKKQKNSEVSYYIYFKPNQNILKDGTKPLYLMEELLSIGKARLITHNNKLPSFLSLNPVLCYTEWEMLLYTAETEDVIKEVFIFVDQESEIIVEELSNINVLEIDAVNSYISSKEINNKLIGVDVLKELIVKFERTSTPENILQDNDRDSEGKIYHDIIEHNDVKKQKNKEKNSVSIRVDSVKIDELINIVSELVTIQARFNLIAEKSFDPELVVISEAIEKITRNLRDNAFDISLVAIRTLKTRFNRLIRDLSLELNKDIEFITEGDDTQVDKNIIEELVDPLLHIFRNSIDHGLEGHDERIAAGKPVRGSITMKAYYSGTEVHIRVEDDGRGIDPEKIRQKAIERGLIKGNENLSKHQIFDLLFLPGFSTATSISEVSGRGVGMDVVRKKIDKMKGRVDVDSELGKGTAITIRLPLTLSIIDGLLVSIYNVKYLIPMLHINKIVAISHKEIIESFNNILVIQEEQIPFLDLRKEFSYPKSDEERKQAVIVMYNQQKMALVVDDVNKEFQAVVKSLGEHYKGQQYFSGASILGDGSVALILDTNKIIEKFTRK